MGSKGENRAEKLRDSNDEASIVSLLSLYLIAANNEKIDRLEYIFYTCTFRRWDNARRGVGDWRRYTQGDEGVCFSPSGPPRFPAPASP